MIRTVSAVISDLRDNKLITVCFCVSAVSQNCCKYIVLHLIFRASPSGGVRSEGFFIESIPKGYGFELLWSEFAYFSNRSPRFHALSRWMAIGRWSTVDPPLTDTSLKGKPPISGHPSCGPSNFSTKTLHFFYYG